MNQSASTTLSVRVPFSITKRGGRKLMVAPDGSTESARPRIDNALVKALARAHRWKRMLEHGGYMSLTEMAEAEKINLPYLSRVLRLALLAPDLVEAILDGRQGAEVTLALLMEPFPLEWARQRLTFRQAGGAQI